MDRQGELSIIRAAYAKQILAAARVADNARLEAALSATRREDFLGAGPWWIRRFQDYVTTPDADPVYLYTDDLVGIRDEVSERALAEAFAKGGWTRITRLYRHQEIPDERCGLRGSECASPTASVQERERGPLCANTGSPGLIRVTS
jgi:hypothetical protein